MVALRHFGFAGDAAVLPDRSNPALLATVQPGSRRAPCNADHELFEAIENRHTHRSIFEPRPVPDAVLTQLRHDAERAGAALHLVRDEARQQVAALVARGDRQQLADRAFRTELASWVRSNYTRQLDGMPGYAFGMPGLPSLIGPLFMRTVNIGRRQAAKDERLALTAPALLLLTTAGDTPPDCLAAGQAVGTVLLRATAAGLAASFLNQPIEVPSLRAPLARLVAPLAGQPQLLLRIGYPTTRTRPTPRRTVADVLIDTPSRSDNASPASRPS
jgi:hypothetical protein